MSGVVLDTHVFARGLVNDHRLTQATAERIEKASAVWISSISFYEIGQKVRLGKWPQMAPFVSRLETLMLAEGGRIAEIDAAIAIRAAALEWTHRDPFDRLIAATAMELKAPLVSNDAAFDELSELNPAWPGRLW